MDGEAICIAGLIISSHGSVRAIPELCVNLISPGAELGSGNVFRRPSVGRAGDERGALIKWIPPLLRPKRIVAHNEKLIESGGGEGPIPFRPIIARPLLDRHFFCTGQYLASLASPALLYECVCVCVCVCVCDVASGL